MVVRPQRVGFFLTAAFPRHDVLLRAEAGRSADLFVPLSIIHFWALSFMYMWVGGHHLHWTALPDWASSLAAAFSIMLLLPSWGGMINGIMTLSGAWDKLRTDPIMLFLITALSFYGMSTFEGPMMSLKASTPCRTTPTGPSATSLRCARLGRDDLFRFLLSPDPRLWETRLYSVKLVYVHFWLATIGIVLYIASMWVSGIGRGLMLRAFDDYGNLAYTSSNRSYSCTGRWSCA